uniref:Matrix metallopeptidase 20a (enamelysin) n=1 Tax=Scleropages formosus TaxID=113540 RepID=A0A8C9RJ98_SCLFO
FRECVCVCSTCTVLYGGISKATVIVLSSTAITLIRLGSLFDGALRSKRDTTAMERNIQKMQDFFGLEVSGRLDPKTLEVMKRPRCGVPDVDNYSFYPDKPRWTNRTITYRIMKYTPDLSREEVESSLRRALKLWSDAAPLRFLRVDSGKADIMITFGSKGMGESI